MKKAIVILLVGALSTTLLLAACGQKEQPADTPAGSGAAVGSAGSEAGGSSAGMALLGGWSLAQDLSISLTEEDQVRFDKAVEGLTGAGYTPVTVLATQLVAGRNYAYLCKTVPVSTKAIPHWTVAVVYEDLQGEVSLTNVQDIDLTNLKTGDIVDMTGAAGAWEIALPEGAAAALPNEDAQAAFDAAIADYTGVGLKPLTLLGTQVVAGMNFKYLCYGETVTENPVSALYVVDVYRDLEGNAEITDCSVLDLIAYVTPPIED